MLRHLYKQARLDARRSWTSTKLTTQWKKPMSTTTTTTTSSSVIPRLVQEHQSVSSVVEQLNESQGLTNTTGNELLGHYATQGHWQEAQEVYDQVFRYASSSSSSNNNNNNNKGNQDMLRSSMTTYGLLMEAYIRGDSVDEAMDIYYSLKDYMEMQPVTAQQKGLLFDTRFYTRLITTLTNHTSMATDSGDDWVSPHLGYTVDDGAEEIMNLEKDSSRGLRLAITLFQDMRQQGLPTDQAIYLSLLARCGQEKDVYYLQQVHQYLRMDDGIELDGAMVYGLMDAYRQVGDEDAMVFELWENIGDSNMLDLVLDLCREKKYKHHAARIWIQLGPEQRTTTSYRQIVTCFCESGEWHQAKELLVDFGKDRPGYTDLVELLVEYGHQQGIQADQWNDLV